MPSLRFKHHPALIAILSLLFRNATAALINRTIDDQQGDSVTGAMPTYYPEDPGTRCTNKACENPPALINNSQAFDETWTQITYAGTSERAVQVWYTGTNVYIYNIVIHSTVPEASSLANLTFYLDSEFLGFFDSASVSAPAGSEPSSKLDVSYDVLVFSSYATVPYGTHDLLMILSGIAGASAIFDYVIYTTDDSPSSSQSPTALPTHSTATQSQSTSTLFTPSLSTPATIPDQTSQSHGRHAVATASVVGGTVGGVGVALLAILSFLVVQRLWRKRRTGQQSRASDSILGSEASDTQNPATLTPYDVTTVELQRQARKLPVGQYDGSLESGVTPSIEPEDSQVANGLLDDTAVEAQNARITEFTRQIQLLQTQVDELRAARSAARSTQGAVVLSAAEQSLSPLLAAPRGEVAELGEQHTMGHSSGEVPPSYRE